MGLRQFIHRASERAPGEGVELQIDRLPADDELHLRLVHHHHPLELLRLANHAEHRALGEGRPKILLAERTARPAWQLARGHRLLRGRHIRRRQHDAIPGRHEHELLTIFLLLRQLLLDALERLLYRADLQARRRIGEPLTLQAVEPGPRLRGLPLQIRDREVEIDARHAGQFLPLLHEVTGLHRQALQPPSHRHVDHLLAPRPQFGGAPHPLRQRNQGDRSQHRRRHDASHRDVESLHFVTPPGNIEKLDHRLHRPDHQAPEGSASQDLPQHLEPVGLEHAPGEDEN